MMPRVGRPKRAPHARQQKLRELLVEKRTLKRYNQATQWFLQWLTLVGIPVAGTYELLDQQLGEYLEFLWETDQRYNLAGDTLSGVSHHTNAKRKLPFAWRLLSAWKRHEVPVRAPPMSRLMAQAIAAAALQDQQPWFGLSILIGFHAFLRTTELLSLTAGQILCGQTHTEVVIDLGYTKSGKRRGTRELVVLDDPVTVALVKLALVNCEPGTLLIRSTAASWRSNFEKYVGIAGLQGFGLKPYSLRRGGATAFFVHTGSIALALERGRWGQSSTARVYLTEGRVVAQNFAVPQDLRQHLESLAAVFQW